MRLRVKKEIPRFKTINRYISEDFIAFPIRRSGNDNDFMAVFRHSFDCLEYHIFRPAPGIRWIKVCN